jgi:hypothetical protein
MCLYSCGEVRLGYAKKHYIWGGEIEWIFGNED